MITQTQTHTQEDLEQGCVFHDSYAYKLATQQCIAYPELIPSTHPKRSPPCVCLDSTVPAATKQACDKAAREGGTRSAVLLLF